MSCPTGDAAPVADERGDDLRLGDAATFAGVSLQAMRLATEVGDLEARRDAKRVLIREADLLTWMNRHDLVRDE